MPVLAGGKLCSFKGTYPAEAMRDAECFKKAIRADVQTRPGHKKPRSQRCSPAKKCETETICTKLRVFMGFRSFPFVMQIREMILREKMLNLESRSRLQPNADRQASWQAIVRHERQMIIALKA